MPNEPTDAEIFKEGFASAALDMHTVVPAIVKSYDRKTQTAQLQPAIKRALQPEDPRAATQKFETLPIAMNVPVGHPGAGKLFVHFHLKKGDSVWLFYCESSISQWRDTGKLSEPGDLRRFGLNGAFCIPAARPTKKLIADVANPLSDIGDDEVAIGFDGGQHIVVSENDVRLGKDAAEAVALASAVQAELQRLKAAIAAAATAEAAASGLNGMTSLKSALDALLPPFPDTMAAEKVKAK